MLQTKTLALPVLLGLLVLGCLAACGRHHPRTPPAGCPDAPVQPAPDALTEEQHPAGMRPLPPVLELDTLCSSAFKGVHNGAQVESAGADYAIAESTTGREESIEVAETSLNLRAYEPGDYTYALFAQEVGDGVMGGGQDDDIPLSSLLDTQPCSYGGGQDEDIPLFYYLGLADYSAGSWRWFGPYTEGGVTLRVFGDGLTSRFKSPQDNYYVVVLAASPGRGASALPQQGQVAQLPLDVAARAASQEGEVPGGVRINRLVTDAEAGHQTVPGVVTGLQAAAGPTSLSLAWDPNPDPDVLMHHVYRKEAQLEAGLAALADVDAPAATYEDATADTGKTYLYAVRAVNAAGAGGFAYVLAGREAPPLILGVTPTTGCEGKPVRFGAKVLGTEPLSYFWDFGGGAAPDTSSDRKPIVTPSTLGIYSASLTVSNSFGEDTCGFELRVLSGEPKWRTFTVVSEGIVGSASSLAVVNGHPAIAYVDSTAAEVRYVCASDPWGMAWSVPVSVGTGGASSMSLRVVANHPAVAYLTAGFNGELRYVRALDATGNGWAAPAALQACSDLTMDASLAIVNGKPAISYQGDSCLRYVQASDAEGASWGTPVTVDDTWLSGAFNTLVVVNGRPAISYYMAGLRYVRANDADGSAWGTPIGVVPDEAEGTGNWAAMLVLGGVPAVSFYESISAQAPARGMLSFIRAADADGVSWHPRQVLDDGAGGDVGRGSALALIGGLPAVSYVDDTNGALVHIWALDARGESWAAPQVVDGSGHVGGRCSLAEVNGCPAISYCDGYNWDLKYAAYF